MGAGLGQPNAFPAETASAGNRRSMICHTYKCIFIHQRRCAGSSIIYAFNLNPDNPDWHFMNDGVLSPEYTFAPAAISGFPSSGIHGIALFPGGNTALLLATAHCTMCLPICPPRGHDYRHLTRPQHAILYDAHDHLVVDYLIRFESLQQDFDQVCDIIGKPRRVLAHRNRGVRKHYPNYFDEDSRRTFLRHFGKDVELFEYDD